MKNFSLESTAGEKFNLKDNRGRKLVIYFYPKDSTSGCTREGQDFSKLHHKFLKANAEVVGISRDTLSSHIKFRDKYKFEFHLLSDSEEVACSLFDVIKMKNMYGKKVRGIERSTFVLDEAGKIIKEWRKVKVDGHAAEVLEFLRSAKD